MKIALNYFDFFKYNFVVVIRKFVIEKPKQERTSKTNSLTCFSTEGNLENLSNWLIWQLGITVLYQERKQFTLDVFSYSFSLSDVLCTDNKGNNQNIVNECEQNINDISFGCCSGLIVKIVALDIYLYIFLYFITKIPFLSNSAFLYSSFKPILTINEQKSGIKFALQEELGLTK